jgi:hypothetical protein
MLEFEVKLIPVVIASFVPMIIGSLWFSQLLFGKLWLRLIGKKMEDIQGSPMDFVYAFVASLVTAFFLSVFVHSIYGDPDLLEGVLIGLIVGICFRGMSTLVYSVFEGPPYGVWALNIIYDTLALAIMGAIVTFSIG